MGGLFGPSLSEIKVDIDNQLKNLYNSSSNGCQTREELDTRLGLNYTKGKLMKNVNNDTRARLYYNKVKEKYLDRFDLILRNRQLEEKFNNLILNKQNDNYSQQLLEKEISRNNEKIRDLENQNYQFLQEMQEMYRKQQEDLINHQNYLRIMQEKSHEEIEKKDKALKEIMKQYQTDMMVMKQKAEKDKKEFEEKQKKAEENNKRIIENLEKRIKEEKDELKKQELIKQQEINKKKEEIRKEFTLKIENMKKEKINEILNNFENIKDNYCIDKISEFSNEKIELFIFKLFKTEKIARTINYHLKIFIDNIQHKIKNIEHMNILLAGPSGAGKSTLINALLNTNAKVSFGKPETKEFQFYSSNNIPFLRLTDTRGIEKNNTFGVNSICTLIEDYIQNKIKENDPDKYIHSIWYCWCGTRLEDSEFELLKKLSEQYTLSKLPIIIVYTQATNKKAIEDAKAYILSNFKINEDDFIPVLAEEVPIANSDNKALPFGLNKLIEVSINKVTNAIDSACYQGLLGEMKTIIKNKLNDMMKILKKNSYKESNNISLLLSKESKMEDLQKEIENFIINLNYQYFFLDTEINYDKETGKAENRNLHYTISRGAKIDINYFSAEYFEETYKYFNKNIEGMAEKFAKELLNKISNFQMDFNRSHQNLLEVTWTSSDLEIQLKNAIKESVYQKFELFAIKNSFNFITNKLIDEFGKFFFNSYIEGMEHKEFKDTAKSLIRVSFDKINEKIKEYIEKNKEKIPVKCKEVKQKKEERPLQRQLFDEEEEENFEEMKIKKKNEV